MDVAEFIMKSVGRICYFSLLLILFGLLLCSSSSFVEAISDQDVEVLIPAVNVTFPDYESNVTYTSTELVTSITNVSILQHWYHWEHIYMDAVQPLKLNSDFIQTVLDKKDILLKNVTLMLQVLNTPQLRGVLAMVVTGILYIIMVPLCGIIWCMYRCCCYKNRQKFDPDGYTKKRFCLSTFTLLWITLLISAAIMCYLAGADFMRSANNVDPVMTAAVQDIGNLTNDIASEIKFTVRNGYGITSQQIKDQLNKVGAQLGDVVIKELTDSKVIEALKGLIDLGSSSKKLSVSMNASKSALDALVDQVVVLQTKTNDLSTSAKNCGLVPGDCPPTSGARDQLATLTAFMTTLVATFRNLQTQMQTPINQINDALNANYTAEAQEGYDNLMNMTAIIMEKTAPLRAQIIAKLNELPGQFEPIIAQIDGNLGPVHDMFGKQLASFRTFTPHITSYGKYGDISVIVIATFVLLVAILMLLGSTIGLWKFDRAVPPTQRKGAVTCGNFCLIFAVVLILLFAWIIMIVTMVFFVGGTQSQASLCPVLQGAPNNFTMLDDIVDFMEQRFAVKMPVLFGAKVRPGQLMMSCMANQPLFVTLNLGSQFKIAQIRDKINAYNISGQLNSIDANLNNVVIYSNDTDVQFQKILAALSFDFAPFNVQLDVKQKPLPYTEVGWFRGNITNVKNSGAPAPAGYYDDVLGKLDAVQAQMQVVDAGRTSVSANISALDISMTSLKKSASSTQDSAKLGQKRLSDGGLNATVKQGSTLFAKRTFDIVDQFLSYFETSIMTKAGRCRPAYNAVQSIAVLLCDGFISPLNGFWFALGLALIVFLFALCCNCSLARYYKRAKVSDTRETRRSTFTERRQQLMNMNNPIRRARKVGTVPAASIVSVVEEEGRPPWRPVVNTPSTTSQIDDERPPWKPVIPPSPRGLNDARPPWRP